MKYVWNTDNDEERARRAINVLDANGQSLMHLKITQLDTETGEVTYFNQAESGEPEHVDGNLVLRMMKVPPPIAVIFAQ